MKVYIKMDKKIDTEISIIDQYTEIEKHRFHQHKIPILINYIDIINKNSFSGKGFKYFID